MIKYYRIFHFSFQNKSVHMYNWPGCQVPMRGLVPAFGNDRDPEHTADEFSNEVKTSLKAIREGKFQFAGERCGGW